MTPPALKVFFLVERLARAGTELHLLQLVRLLDRTRFEPVLCCLNRRDSDLSLVPEGVKLHCLDGRWNLVHPRSLPLFAGLCRILGQEKPDILHAFLFVSEVLGAFAARRAGVPAVLFSRGRMGIEWQAHCLHRILQRAADRRCDAILCKTQAMRREIAEAEGAPLEKIHVVPNGVSTADFRFIPGAAAEARSHLARTAGIPEEGPLLLAVGNLKPIKDQITLVRAAAVLLMQMPRLQFAFVGEGESRGPLEEAVRALGLPSNIHLPGAREDVRPWMRAADLLVSASLSEGQPNAVLEAMALGVPTVLTAIPGHQEACGTDAWYFEPGNVHQLVQCIQEALGSPSLRAQRGHALAERAHSEYSVETMVARIQNLYDRLAGR